MRMRHGMAVAAALLFSAVIHPVTAEENKIVSLPQDRIAAPDDGTMSGVVVLISNSNGWDAEEDAARDAVMRAGAITIGVDLRQWLSALATETDRDCLFLPADIERLSRELHRRHKADFYRPPRILGFGEGGALALAIAAQTPNGSFAETIGETVAIDPTEAVALPKSLCTPAPKRETASGTAYGLSPGTLPNPVRIVFSPAADAAAKAHAATLQEGHTDIVIATGEGTPGAVLVAEATALVERLTPDDASLDLPLVEDIVTPEHDTLAIFYSGDGGWREIDQRIAAGLSSGGVPVIGVDALRYFWSEKAPEDTAADLSRIIKTYRQRLGISRVVLVGYSFGANILPKVYTLLPEEDRKSIDLLALLALSHQADFEIAITGWMGVAGLGKHGDPVDHLARVEPGKIQCFYGLEDQEAACPALAGRVAQGTELIARTGGHHFDGNYELLAEMILARLRQR